MVASKTDSPLKILLAVDGSPDAEAAVNLLSRITWPAGTLIHVLTTTPEPGSWLDSLVDLQSEVGQKFTSLYQRSWVSTKTLAGQAANSLYTSNVVVKTEIWQGSPTSVILERARELAAHLIVVGAKGFNAPAHALLGSTTTKIASNPYANYSILVARPSTQMQPLSVILVIDKMFEAWPAVEFLCALSLSNWAKITIMHVTQERVGTPVGDIAVAGYASPSSIPPLWQDAEAQVASVLNRLHACGAQGWNCFRYGNLTDEILSAAQEQEADLIVIGASADIFLTQQVIATAPCSVLIVKGEDRFSFNV